MSDGRIQSTVFDSDDLSKDDLLQEASSLPAKQSVVLDETNLDLDAFFEKYRRHPQRLVPAKLPGRPGSFQEFLKKVFGSPEIYTSKRKEIASHCETTTNAKNLRLRALVVTCFPPLTVGSLPGKSISYSFKGDVFPQFTQVQNANFQCSICIPYVKWALENNRPHASCKSKKASADAILAGTAHLQFSGLVQLKEHSNSKCHLEAIDFWVKNEESPKQASGSKKEKTVNSQKSIKNYFSCSPLN